jgi:type VI secretion system protein ImpB
LSKPIQEQIFKSRLTITYRTNITGTPQQERLPYRLLVLGEFEGRDKRAAGLLPDLATRTVRSIKRGTTVDDHINEVVPTWHIPHELSELRSVLPGQVILKDLVCTIPVGAIKRQEKRGYPVTGTAIFESKPEQNGLGDIDGALEVSGSIEVDIDDKGNVTPLGGSIRLSGMVVGDYKDQATEKKIGLVTGLLHDKVVSLPQDKIKDFLPKEDFDADPSAKVKVFEFKVEEPQSVNAERTVPFTKLTDFSPDAVAANIPELQRLRVLKLMILELQSMLRNRPDLRKQVKDALPKFGKKDKPEEALAQFKDLQAWAKENFGILKIER